MLILIIFTYAFEGFVNITLDFLIHFVRKGMNMAFSGLGRSTCFCNPVIPAKMIENSMKMRELVSTEMEDSSIGEPPRKKFKPKNDLPKLDNYKQGADDSYWGKWPKLNWTKGRQIKSNIDANLLRSLCNQTNYPFPDIMETMLHDVEEGTGICVSN